MVFASDGKLEVGTPPWPRKVKEDSLIDGICLARFSRMDKLRKRVS
jgi:hypothetical protein